MYPISRPFRINQRTKCMLKFFWYCTLIHDFVCSWKFFFSPSGLNTLFSTTKSKKPGLGIRSSAFERIARFVWAKDWFAFEKLQSLPSLFYHERRERIAHSCSYVKSGGSDSLTVAFWKERREWERFAHGRAFLKSNESESLTVALFIAGRGRIAHSRSLILAILSERAKSEGANFQPCKKHRRWEGADFSPPCSLHYESRKVGYSCTYNREARLESMDCLSFIVNSLVAAAFCSGELKRGNLIHSGGSNWAINISRLPGWRDLPKMIYSKIKEMQYSWDPYSRK